MNISFGNYPSVITITLSRLEAEKLTEQLITHVGEKVTASNVIENLTNHLSAMFPEEVTNK